MAYNAQSIANAFLELAKRDGKRLTNMQLQKLVYIAHGFNLALMGEPLFFNNVHAFQWGPVIPKLYKLLSKYGAGNVTELVESDQPIPPPDSPEMKIIERVWRNYGELGGMQLSAITHKENTPWSKVWEKEKFGIIPNELIASHYATLLNGQG